MKTYGVTKKKDKNQRWIDFCLKLSKKYHIDNYRHVACLIKSNRIIKHAANVTKAGVLIDPIYELKQTHAELSLLCKLNPKVIEGSVLYVAGWSKSGSSMVLSKPCECCQEYLKKFNLKAVYYGLPDGGYEKLSG